MEKTIKGYKAFNKDMTCQGFQYEEGKTYKHKGQPKVCPTNEDLRGGKGGFHFCEIPHDVLSYYPAGLSKFHQVESLGKVD